MSAITESTNTDFPPFQLRVIDELNELCIKSEALNKFIKTDIFTGLPQDEQVRLKRQSAIMIEYRGVLAERISAFKITGKQA